MGHCMARHETADSCESWLLETTVAVLEFLAAAAGAWVVTAYLLTGFVHEGSVG